MQVFDFLEDNENFEIFPKDIWTDPNVVYHGTSEYHSMKIEENGFIPATSPFNVEDAKALINTLQDPRVSKFDIPKFFGITTKKSLNSYVFGIENGDLRLSFTYLSLLAAVFSTGRNKGGQTFGNIRDSETLLEQAIKSDDSAIELLTEPIINIFNVLKEVSDADGVVYAVKVDSPFKGLTEENGYIHSKLPIDKESIIGKVFLPKKFDISNYGDQKLKAINKQKLIKPGHLGIILNRKK